MNQANSPRITVLMPVYNCEFYIKEAIDSILNQTFTDFEFLIIDDASTDKTVSIIKEFKDSRILLIEKDENKGISDSLNYGLKVAKGEYIARMDGDDISLPERFEKQIAFLDANPEVVLCGTLYNIIGNKSTVLFPETHESIKLSLLRYCCIAHPTVMLRKSTLNAFEIFYDESKEPAEDYALWGKLVLIGKLYNLQEILLNYRVHSTQVSQKRATQQKNSSIETKVSLLNYSNVISNENELQVLKKIFGNMETITFDEIKLFQKVKVKLIFANSGCFFDKDGFKKYLFDIENQLLKDYFIKRTTYSPLIYFQYLKVKYKLKFKLIPFYEFKIFIKSIIFYRDR